MAERPPSFAAKHADPRSVSSALAAAEAAYRRGDRGEALKALRRAVEAASDEELDMRALELAKVAADLATQIDTVPHSSKPAAGLAPLKPQTTQVKAVPSKAPAIAPTRAVSHAPKDKDEAVASTRGTAKEEAKKADRKSLSGEVTRGRTPSIKEDGTEPARPPHAHEPGPARKKAVSRADRAERGSKRVSRTDEIDEWPTEALTAGDLPEALLTTSTSAPPFGPVTQAARVLLWREADGSVRMTAAGQPAPADAIEAMVAALSPEADLRALLRDRR